MKQRTRNGVDDVDWAILSAVQDNARISFAELGRRVNLTAPAVAERVRQMEDAGILRGYRAEVSFERLGLPVSALIRVSAAEEKCPALMAYVKTLPEVIECHHVTGSDAYVLRVTAVSLRHLEAVIETIGRYGTPTTAIILSSPVAARSIAEPPTTWPLAKSAARRSREHGVMTMRRR